MKHILFCIFFPIIVLGQINESNKLPEMMPTSPKSFEFLKYTEIPVSKYTGVPNISIPLFNIEAKGLTIPISLSYHSNGFKVNEESGSTGLGWMINNNWNIIQVVRGYDDYGLYRNRTQFDIEYEVDLQYNRTDPIYFGTPEAIGYKTIRECNDILLDLYTTPFGDGNGKVLTFEDKYLVDRFKYGQIDFEPDLFIFSLPGFSGKFVLDWANEKYICLTDNKIKITPVNFQYRERPSEFCIQVPDGHVFTFTLKEETEIIQSSSQNEDGVNSLSVLTPNMFGSKTSRVYQLTQIVTNKAETVSLEYITTNTIKNFPDVAKSKVLYKSALNSRPFPNDLSRTTTNYSVTQQYYSYLSKITFNNGTLIFNYSDRIDWIGSKKLDNIALYKETYLPTIKKINFNYDYFIGHSQGTNTDSYFTATAVTKQASELTHRLKLTSLQELGSNPYLFEYDPEPLPKKTSLAKDYWGNYNGFLTNNSSFVDIHKFNLARDVDYYSDYKDNINCSNLQFARASILNKITYPTGGYSLFNYELNSFENIKIPDINQGQKKYVQVSTVPNHAPSFYSVIIEGGNTIFKGSGILSTRGCPTNDYTAYSRCYLEVKHFNKNLLTYINNNPYLKSMLESYNLRVVLITLDFLDGNPSNPELYNQFYNPEASTSVRMLSTDPNEKLVNNLIFNLPEGIAIFQVFGGCGTYAGNENSSQASFTFSYNDYKPLTNLVNYGAGIRVKDITTYSNQNTIASKKIYTYYGGKLMSPPKFYNSLYIPDYTWLEANQGSSGQWYNTIGYKSTLSSNSFIAPSTSAIGKFVGYDIVEEKNESFIINPMYVINNGKIKEYFINNPDSTPVGSDFLTELNAPAQQIYPDNGLVTKQEIFDKNNFLLKEISNGYSFNKLNCVYGMKLVFRKSNYRIIFWAGSNQQFAGENYSVIAYPSAVSYTSLVSTTEKKYFNNDTSLSNFQEYKYNDFNQNIYTKTKNSNNEIIETYSLYPKDYSTIGTVYGPYVTAQQMYIKNILSPLITKIIKKNNEIISKEEFEYLYKATINSPYYPDIFVLNKYKFAKGNQDLENKINYDQYDSTNNIIELSKESLSVSYLWGYNDVYPIAKIENAKYNSITPGLIDAAKSASNSGSETLLLTALANLRASLPNSMITTYTYKPLVGVSTITDPKGYTTYYNYDTFGRLQNVKDKDGKILSENEYHYKQ